MFDHDQENTAENADLGETIALNYVVCERDIEALLVFNFQRQKSNRIGIAIMAIVGFFSIQIAAIKTSAILLSREPVTPGSLTLIVVTALVGLWMGRTIWKNRNVHARARTVMASMQFRGSLQDLEERVECVFSWKGVSFEMRNVYLEFNWDAILGVARTDDYFFLVLSPTTSRSIPLSGLSFFSK